MWHKRKKMFSLENVFHRIMDLGSSNAYISNKKRNLCTHLLSFGHEFDDIVRGIANCDFEGGRSSSSEDGFYSLKKLKRIKRTNHPRFNNTLAVNGATSQNLQNGDIGQTSRKRKLSSASDDSMHNPAKKNKTITPNKQSERKCNDQNLINSFEKSEKKQIMHSKRIEKGTEDESNAEDTQTREPMSIPTSIKFVRRQVKGHQEESAAGESGNEEFRNSSVKKWEKHVHVESDSCNQAEKGVSRNKETPSRGNRRKAVSTDVASQDGTSENETSLGQLNVSNVDEQMENKIFQNIRKSSEKLDKRRLQDKGRKKDIKDNLSTDESQNEEPASTTTSIKSVGRRRKGGHQEDSNSDESENEEFVSGNLTSFKNPKNHIHSVFRDSSKQKLSSQTSVKSVKRQDRRSQEELTSDESQEEFENPASVKRRKIHKEELSSQNEPQKAAYGNTGTYKRRRNVSEKEVAGLIIKGKSKPFVRCPDVLKDPAFKLYRAVIKYKTDNISNSSSPRDDDSAKDEFKIIDDADEYQGSSKNPENENVDTEDIKDSPKRSPSSPCEFMSYPAELKNTESRGNSMCKEKGRQEAFSIDAAETFFNQVGGLENEDVQSTTNGHSESDSDENSGVDQDDKSNEMEADINEGAVGDTKADIETNSDEADAVTNSEFDEADKQTDEADEQETEGNHSASIPVEACPDNYDPYSKRGPATPPGPPPETDDEDDSALTETELYFTINRQLRSHRTCDSNI